VELLDQQEIGEITLKMSWLTKSHPEAAYAKRPGIDFQVVRGDGIDISLRGSFKG
jgi:hypothetical protein